MPLLPHLELLLLAFLPLCRTECLPGDGACQLHVAAGTSMLALKAKVHSVKAHEVNDKAPDTAETSQEPEGCGRNDLLTEQPRRHDMSFAGYNDHLHGLQGLFVYPPNKFAFCLIEKNACSTWIGTVLLNLLEHGSGPAPALEAWQDAQFYNTSRRSQEKYGRHGMESIFHDPTATRAVFVREPLERFVSAFLNKCALYPMGDSQNCKMQTRVFRDAVQWALSQDVTQLDGHWRPQAFHCDLENRIESYNLITWGHKDSLAHDMNCVLSKVGLSNFVKEERPQINPSKLSSTAVLQKLFTKSAALQLIEHMHHDYDLFGFPRVPSWVEGATGEWYEELPSEASMDSVVQESTGKFFSQETLDDDDLDDLAELATRAGYF